MNTQKKLIPTFEKVEVLNYPYGFKLRTTLYDFIEFDVKKGYRHCTQTICPKTNRINKPKKSTYSQLVTRFFDDNGHIKTMHFDFNGDKKINEGAEFLYKNFDLFTETEIKYFYATILSMSFIDFKATCIYGGAKPEDIKPFYEEFWNVCKTGVKEGSNLFNLLKLDIEQIESKKPENFNPFKVTEYIIA
jgi:hypothetical protein